MFFRKKITLPATDETLIEAYRHSRDKSHVGILYERYAHIVFGVCMKYLKNRDESRDATLQIFEKLINDLLVHQITYFKGWLHTVTRNYCLMELRKSQRRGSEYALEELEGKLAEDTNDDSLLGEIKLQELEKAIGLLAEPQRICIDLFYLKGKSYRETATLSGYPEKQVKSHLQNGKRNLKLILSQHHAFVAR